MISAQKDQNSRGFSLVEVIIAVFLTGVIVLVIANIPQAIRIISGSQSESKVREVAAKKIEDIRLSGYDNLANGTTPISDSRINKLDNVIASTVITDCAPPTCSSGAQIKKVTVTISWQESNEPKTFQVTTLVAKDGLR